MLDDPLQLFVNQLYTTHAGLLQSLNLPLHQQLEGHLGHKECGTRTLQEKKKSQTHAGSIIHLLFLRTRELD